MTIANTSNHLFVSLPERSADRVAKENYEIAKRFFERSNFGRLKEGTVRLKEGTMLLDQKVSEKIRNSTVNPTCTLKLLKQSDR